MKDPVDIIDVFSNFEINCNDDNDIIYLFILLSFENYPIRYNSYWKIHSIHHNLKLILNNIRYTLSFILNMNEHSKIYDMRLKFFASTILLTITAYYDRKKSIERTLEKWKCIYRKILLVKEQSEREKMCWPEKEK